MDRATHIIDPDGEVIIVLQNPNAPFAILGEAITSDNLAYTFPGPSNGIQDSAERLEALRNEPPETLRKRKKHKKKKGSTSGWRAVHNTSESIHPSSEESAPGWLAAEIPVAEPSEQSAEQPADELAEQFIEQPADELAEQPAEQSADEPVEEPVDEPVDEPAEGPAEIAVTEQLEEECFRIQVSAKHLILASSVFRRLLTGGWKESINYLQKGSVEITADSWDVDALLIMLRIIHCQSRQIPRKLTLEMLAKVAVLTDYYNCREAVVFFADTWIDALDDFIPATYSRNSILWLWVAWYFNLPAKFKEASSSAMSSSNGWIDNIGLPIPDKIIRSMNDKRQEAIAGLILRLEETRDELQNGSKGCGFECSSIMYGALTREMHLNDLFWLRPVAPFPDLSYRSLVQKVLSFRSPVWYGPTSYRSNYRHNCVSSTFELLFGVLEDTIEGQDLNDSVNM
ncbi:hypothetical protein BO82DRAFT_359969 [Aspergillus uvarum CBS 121591]|uniref:BTB domain-containing protein n=1 Tax=Aspergillus uvarum CBS 121591 TaxID=1448315 RepID=A0A319CJC0_9EURO|nr:hypothetical protein BO82DRAFT_359969 [Aspergillus uvarum CBS 121591]PYH75518.1 hypothetical protein BO82DRAFT_359969 [Aspergillus uvarum CBS 121591]